MKYTPPLPRRQFLWRATATIPLANANRSEVAEGHPDDTVGATDQHASVLQPTRTNCWTTWRWSPGVSERTDRRSSFLARPKLVILIVRSPSDQVFSGYESDRSGTNGLDVSICHSHLRLVKFLTSRDRDRVFDRSVDSSMYVSPIPKEADHRCCDSLSRNISNI